MLSTKYRDFSHYWTAPTLVWLLNHYRFFEAFHYDFCSMFCVQFYTKYVSCSVLCIGSILLKTETVISISIVAVRRRCSANILLPRRSDFKSISTIFDHITDCAATVVSGRKIRHQRNSGRHPASSDNRPDSSDMKEMDINNYCNCLATVTAGNKP